MTLDKLKVAARQHEQREEWREAIELYRQAAREGEGESEGDDPSVYNRIGDLEHRLGNIGAACQAWDQAASRYGEHGLTNNAIALCNKILRLEPSRIRTYLDLATYQARKRMLFDVRANLAAYRDRMMTIGQTDECRESLERFGATFGGWRELRRVMDELLGRDAAEGDEGTSSFGGSEGGQGLIFIDTGPVEFERASEPAADDPLHVESTMLDGLQLERPGDGATMPGLESSPLDAAEGRPGPEGAMEGLLDVDRMAAEMGQQAPVEGLDIGATALTPDAAAPLDGLEQREFVPPTEAIAPAAGAAALSDVVFIDLGAAVPAPTEAEPAPAPVEPPPADPNDPLGQRVTATALFEYGDRARGIAALERALELYVERDEALHAWQVAGELIQAEPQSINRYQARVEVAAKMKDTPKLCEAYQALGEALVRAGSEEKAIAVYRRLLELDESHPAARAALRAMVPEGSSPIVPEGFIDFGAMVIDDAGPRSTRMRTETTGISADEDETFREALAEFKRALDQNLPMEDHQAHYDLGIAFKEMGLLEEAIGEFQKALRSTEGRLRTAEALGATFLEKGMPAVAEAVLRSVERGPEDDAEKIGVLYWLGRALESQAKGDVARGFYERVLAVEVSFMDAAERITRIAAEHSA
jgi:tetratricopeptide (TPR) repeat protein